MEPKPDLAAIRAALEAREFFLVYQPVVSLADGRCAGAEALIRWQRGDTVVVEAGEFMPATHSTPLSGLITYWVIDTVADDLGAWLGQHEDAFVAINVPPEILGRGGLEYAAVKSGLHKRVRQLVLEIAEAGVPDQLGLDALQKIPSTGARVALDDTTLSGANLALLTRCHFDFIKIDRTLVAGLVDDGPRPAWLDGLAALLATTPLQVIAEGVETAFQEETLRTAGVQMAQGQHLSPALSAAGFRRFFATSRGLQP